MDVFQEVGKFEVKTLADGTEKMNFVFKTNGSLDKFNVRNVGTFIRAHRDYDISVKQPHNKSYAAQQIIGYCPYSPHNREMYNSFAYQFATAVKDILEASPFAIQKEHQFKINMQTDTQMIKDEYEPLDHVLMDNEIKYLLNHALPRNLLPGQ